MKKLIIPLVILAVVMLVTSIVKRNRQRLPSDTGPRIAATSDDLCVKSEG